ncbi:SLAP domain-containing protein [Companilactobacillus furfuricola]|uniref:SLAP domain-containing protein n=1 Tax=Companilactobacillus furfuricola TaxID=1462575 RepID=UPI001FEC0C2A|nr:SLAP domain-containing protein [Companilactobacillus furfuricola]
MKKKLIALVSVSAGVLASLGFSAQTTDAANVTNIKSVITTKNLSKLYDNKGKLVSNRALAENSDWYTDQYVQMDNVGPVYRVSTNEFVKASDVTVKQDKVYDGTTVNNTGVAHVTYASDYGADVYDAPNGNVTGDKLSNGTSWKFDLKVIDTNGDAWYEVGQNQWLNGATQRSRMNRLMRQLPQYGILTMLLFVLMGIHQFIQTVTSILPQTKVYLLAN